MRNRLPIVSSQYSPVDKAFILWAICIVGNQENCSPNAIAQKYGQKGWWSFNLACDWAESFGLLDQYYMKLTEKGQYAYDNWQAIQDRIFSL